jgi:hypothetical protein
MESPFHPFGGDRQATGLVVDRRPKRKAGAHLRNPQRGAEFSSVVGAARLARDASTGENL